MNPQQQGYLCGEGKTHWKLKNDILKKTGHYVLLQVAQVLLTLACGHQLGGLKVLFYLKGNYDRAVLRTLMWRKWCCSWQASPNGFGLDTFPVFADQRSFATRAIGIFRAK